MTTDHSSPVDAGAIYRLSVSDSGWSAAPKRGRPFELIAHLAGKIGHPFLRRPAKRGEQEFVFDTDLATPEDGASVWYRCTIEKSDWTRGGWLRSEWQIPARDLSGEPSHDDWGDPYRVTWHQNRDDANRGIQ